MKKLIGTLAAAVIGAGIVSASVVTAPEAHAGCDWRYNVWCVPPKPDLGMRAPRWPDPRPPLLSKDNPYCTQPFHLVAYRAGWYAIDGQKVNKRMWPDYYQYTYAFVVYNGAGWVQPDSNRTDPNATFTVNCDA